MRRDVLFLSVIALLAASAPPFLADDDWSRFRGPNGSGVSASKGVPVELGPQTNVEWVAEIPFGRSSPTVARDRIFVTAVEGGKLVTLAFGRADGKLLWRAEAERRETAELHKDTDSATPTPVTDGTNVYVFFHELGLLSYDAAGKERWRVPLGPFRNFYGIAASPVLAGDAVLLVCDQAAGSFVLAVNKKTGKELWRKSRSARLEAFTTPILLPASGKPRLAVISGSRWVDAYDLASGTEVWTLPGVGTGPVASPVVSGSTIYVTAPDQAEGGWPDFAGLLEDNDKDGNGKLGRADVEGVWVAEHFGWLDADQSGEISPEDWQLIGSTMVNDNWGVHAVHIPQGGGKPEILWNYRKNVPYLSSPIVYDGVFYMVHDGIVTALEPQTGAVLKRDRLGEGSPKVYASPVAAEGKIYVATLEGKIAVLTAGRAWSVLRTNDLGDEIWATPAVADGRLYVRTRSKLYSFGGAAKSGGATASAAASAGASAP